LIIADTFSTIPQRCQNNRRDKGMMFRAVHVKCRVCPDRLHQGHAICFLTVETNRTNDL
jgi:hypothetical protein